MPALLTRQSRPPSFFRASSNSLATCARSDTSQTDCVRAGSLLATAASAWLSTSQMCTLAPSRTKAREISSPMPDAPAVTSTRRPLMPRSMRFPPSPRCHHGRSAARGAGRQELAAHCCAPVPDPRPASAGRGLRRMTSLSPRHARLSASRQQTEETHADGGVGGCRADRARLGQRVRAGRLAGARLGCGSRRGRRRAGFDRALAARCRPAWAGQGCRWPRPSA